MPPSPPLGPVWASPFFTARCRLPQEVKHQFETIPGLLQGTPGHGEPDHARCIKISTDASLREMILPGLLVMLSPILTGFLFGVEAVSGLLVGSLVSGVQLAISQVPPPRRLVEGGGGRVARKKFRRENFAVRAGGELFPGQSSGGPDLAAALDLAAQVVPEGLEEPAPPPPPPPFVRH